MESSLLYRRVRVLRWALPAAVLLIVVVTEAGEYLESGRPVHEDLLIFGVGVPLLIWAVSTGLAIGLRQRDAAQARLRILYAISSEVAAAPDVAALVEIAASMLDRLLGPVPVSLIMREQDGSPWTLADMRHLLPGQERALATSVLEGSAALPCAHCPGCFSGLIVSGRLPRAIRSPTAPDASLAAVLSTAAEPASAGQPALARC